MVYRAESLLNAQHRPPLVSPGLGEFIECHEGAVSGTPLLAGFPALVAWLAVERAKLPWKFCIDRSWVSPELDEFTVF